MIDSKRRVSEIAVRLVETGFVVFRAHKCANHTNAAQRLAHDLVDAVRSLLHGPEERHRSSRQQADDDDHERHDDDQQTGEGHVLAERHDDAADAHDRGDDHDVEGHDQDHLNLLDVVRVAGDERRRAEDVGLFLGEAHHPAEDRAAYVPAKCHGRLCSEIHGDDGADTEEERDQQHEAAGAHDVAGVALDHAVVDDVRVQVRQVQVGYCLDRHEDKDHSQLATVGPEIPGEESDHRCVSCLFIGARSSTGVWSGPWSCPSA